jgi:hypothetical protein
MRRKVRWRDMPLDVALENLKGFVRKSGRSNPVATIPQPPGGCSSPQVLRLGTPTGASLGAPRNQSGVGLNMPVESMLFPCTPIPVARVDLSGDAA